MIDTVHPFRRAQHAPTKKVSGAARAVDAYATLRLRLLEGDYAAGRKLSVVELAREFECSRVPVMEALKRLEAEGFVRIVPQVGCNVVVPVAADVRDFFAVFGAVEGLVARFAAERRSAAELEAFEDCCAEIDAALRAAGGPEDRDPLYRRLNLRFHTEIHRLAHSPATSDVAASLWDRSDFYIKLAFGSLFFSRRVRRSHLAIRAAIGSGDAAAAESALRAHLHAVGDDVAARFEKVEEKKR
ncbi:MAG: GntR family transcriptional regulator [Gammaproteobacteria bacterium]|nr:GntR family transcriptional regulator [Gammaproteobacteria bacterium]MBI5616716.1 GntR family transcriptional regulator [Gammaproteobacteria bacterium]